MPFDGVAFLWFIGVLRDRLGQREDRFFSTVFFGSGLLFLAMLFTSAGVIAAIIFVFATQPENMVNSTTYRLARAIAYDLTNVYAIKMAAVFMFSTSTVTLFTGLAPRWIAFLGFGLAAFILLAANYIHWSIFILPTWVFLISTYILIDNLRRRGEAAPEVSASRSLTLQIWVLIYPSGHPSPGNRQYGQAITPQDSRNAAQFRDRAKPTPDARRRGDKGAMFG